MFAYRISLGLHAFEQPDLRKAFHNTVAKDAIRGDQWNVPSVSQLQVKAIRERMTD